MVDHLEWNHDEEKQKRETDLKRLKQTEGWEKLTDRQKKMIEISLSVQQRAERGTDEPSYRAIERWNGDVRIKKEDELGAYLEDGSRFDFGKRRYELSQNAIAQIGCLEAIELLEGDIQKDMRKMIEGGFYLSKNFRDSGFDDFKKNIGNSGFPLVVFTNEDGIEYSPYMVRHAFIVMGKDEQGEYVVFQKHDPGEQVEVVNLEEVYNERKMIAWGIRPLRGTK
jgi:hypothetical protein